MKRFWWFWYWSFTGKAHPEHVKACKVCGGECGQCGGYAEPSYIWNGTRYVRNPDFKVR